MAFDGAAANGFGRHHLHKDKAWALCQTVYPCPPDIRVPGPSGGQGSWHLSAGGIPVPPIPEGVEREYAIADVRRGLTPEQAADPRWRAEDNANFGSCTSSTATMKTSPTEATTARWRAGTTPRGARGGGAHRGGTWAT